MQESVGAASRFETTNWSLIVQAAAGPDGDGGAAALAQICARYWPAVHAFVRRSGFGRDEADDLTQGFFERLLEKDYLGQADRARGRFRSFLFTAVKHFLANELDRSGAKKRGGGIIHVPIDFSRLEAQDIAGAETISPEQLFEKQWAVSLVQTVLDQLRDEMAGEGKRLEFDRLSPYLTGDAAQSFTDLAGTLQVTAGSLRVAVHRLRIRFRDQLRRTISETVSDETQIHEEIRYLIAVLER